MTLYRDEAVVLRTQKLGEADRIITMLTRRTGKVRAVAKGVRRTRSRWGASLEPFTRVDIQCYAGRSLDTVTQAEILRPHALLGGDYQRYTAGTVMLEVTDRLSEEREPTTRLYLLLVAGLGALDDAARDSEMVLDAFLLRAMALSGYEPTLLSCARCGEPGPHRSFSVASGGAVCPSCRPAGAPSPSPASVALMGDLLGGDWPAAEATERRVRREASGLVSAYCEFHLERRLRALPLVPR
ncbi:MAG TPA: DNA repair protein RecO [Mycobacteriales bacterium]|nr:DNA repair protein RecO [Mycobacteriales bacterium]